MEPTRLSTPIGYSLYPHGRAGLPGYPFLQPKNVTRPISNLDRVQYERLRRFSNLPPVFSAVQRITNGVLAMPWRVEPPFKLAKNKAAIALAENAERALKKPNAGILGTYRKLVAGIVDDLLVLNYACVERQPGDEDKPFWLWNGNAGKIRVNPDWNPQVEGLVPKFLDFGKKGKVTGIMAENMFMICDNINTYEEMPRSPLEVAYNFVEAWLGLSDFQQSTTGNATREYLLDLGDISEEQLQAFREYWHVEVIGNKKTASVAGKGQVKVVKLGPSDDSGLYLLYCDYLLKIVALSFNLSNRDLGITDHDNRATANASLDATFANAIKPMAQMVFEGLGEESIDYYLPGFELKVSYKEPRSEIQIHEEIRKNFEVGLIKRNEARQELGFEPLSSEEDGFSGRSSSSACEVPDAPLQERAGLSPPSTPHSKTRSLGNGMEKPALYAKHEGREYVTNLRW